MYLTQLLNIGQFSFNPNRKHDLETFSVFIPAPPSQRRQMNIRRFFRPGPNVTNPANNPTKRTTSASGQTKATAPTKLDLIWPWLKKIMSLDDS